jgi:hypothetical protein
LYSGKTTAFAYHTTPNDGWYMFLSLLLKALSTSKEQLQEIATTTKIKTIVRNHELNLSESQYRTTRSHPVAGKILRFDKFIVSITEIIKERVKLEEILKMLGNHKQLQQM